MARKRTRPLRTFLQAMLYGVALMAAVSNTLALALGLAVGRPELASVPLGLLGWGIVLYIHHRRGWPPFRRATDD